MSRPDPFLNLLKDFGYLPLRLPRADVQPLQLLNVSSKDFSLLGDLADAMGLLMASICLPDQDRTSRPPGQIQGTRSSTVKLSLGPEYPGEYPGSVDRQQP